MAKTAKEIILAHINKRGHSTSSELSGLLDMSRQMVARHLRDLIRSGALIKEGSTKNARYQLNKNTRTSQRKPKSLRIIRKIKDLSEDQVFLEIELRLNLRKCLSPKAHSAAYYGFTEMLNNAIDHSKSKEVLIEVGVVDDFFQFNIRDKGVGVFKNIQKKFSLQDEYQALDHVIKGKQTTFPEAHSGQGIFFTSRVADEFSLRSHKVEYRLDNPKNNKIVGETPFIKGTLVSFRIKAKSRRDLAELFKEYADEDFEFDRTEVRVKLRKEKKLISRSQGKRLVMGLQEYKIIRLDFKMVEEVGQGFVDEVFRVFQQRHPEIQMVYINANRAVEFMIKRAINKPT